MMMAMAVARGRLPGVRWRPRNSKSDSDIALALFLSFVEETFLKKPGGVTEQTLDRHVTVGGNTGARRCGQQGRARMVRYRSKKLDRAGATVA
jgi:hypothetical protein